jgi:hypothetical protein
MSTSTSPSSYPLGCLHPRALSPPARTEGAAKPLSFIASPPLDAAAAPPYPIAPPSAIHDYHQVAAMPATVSAARVGAADAVAGRRGGGGASQ